jgi:ketosteroid isomerase-like protein
MRHTFFDGRFAALCSLLLAALWLSSGCRTPSTPLEPSHGSTVAIDADLQNASREWDRRFNAQDLDGVAALYAEEVVSMPPNLPTMHGRKAVRADLREFFGLNQGQIVTRVEAITMEGTLALERATFLLKYKPRAGGPEVVETGKHLVGRRKIEGKWLIVLEIWNTAQEAPHQH